MPTLKACTVSGSGNVAQYTVEKLIDIGAKVVTLSDSSGFIHEPDGLTHAKLAYVIDLKKNRQGRIQQYAKKYKCKYYANKKPWGIRCDAAFPSAMENEIDEKNACLLVKHGCKIVAEGANMPSTRAASAIFQNAQLLYAPSKAANADGVAISGLEMTQNSMRLTWSREKVEEELQLIMKNIHKQCVRYGEVKKGHVNYVRGANIAGFIKIADTMLAYGIV